ncbi:MAG: carbohydrate porin [bacterium]
MERKLTLIGSLAFYLTLICGNVQAGPPLAQESPYDGDHKHFWRVKTHEHEMGDFFKGLDISGQMTGIYQNSGLDLQPGDLTGKAENHPYATGTFSSDLFIEKEFDNDYVMFDIQYASGLGVDANLQGGGMVNNDVMQDFEHNNQPYIARAYYEHTWEAGGGYKARLDMGRFSVADFFDLGERVADQAVRFINQAICNNGAFDYVQDLQGHGYTFGTRVALETPWINLSGAALSSDSVLDNLSDKYSLIGSLEFHHQFTENVTGKYQIYYFKNFGEYARFDDQGNLVTDDTTPNHDLINTSDNPDNLDKAGFGISIDQSLPMGINLFGKYGKQDDDRDVRHYQDMDESVMFGFDLSGEHWRRPKDVLGIAYQIGRLTGNHRLAHEKGYESFFSRPGIGAGNYADERVLEIYYRWALTDHIGIGPDYQHIENFFYSRKIGGVDFWGARINVGY